MNLKDALNFKHYYSHTHFVFKLQNGSIMEAEGRYFYPMKESVKKPLEVFMKKEGFLF